MAKPSLDFWFDFASTYSYPAAMRIASLAETSGITVRWRPGLSPTQRIVHVVKGVTTIYNPTLPIPDKNSGLTFVVIFCATGTNEGG